MSSKANGTAPSHSYLKLVLRGLPENVDIAQSLETLSLTSLYTHYHPKLRTGWIALSPAPSDNDLLPICKQLMDTTQAISVEKAPLQKIPRLQGLRRDPMINTIESNPHYIKFIESLTKDGTIKSTVKQEPETGKEVKAVAPIVTFLANREKHPQTQHFSGPAAAAAAASDASNRAARGRKKPRKKKEKKKKPDSVESGPAHPPTTTSSVTNEVNKPSEPVNAGVKILTKSSNQPNVRWQIKHDNNNHGAP